jgi:hypothetical protein
MQPLIELRCSPELNSLRFLRDLLQCQVLKKGHV